VASSPHQSNPTLIPPSYRPTPPYCPPMDERLQFPQHAPPDGTTEQRSTWSAPPRPSTLLLHTARPPASRRLYNTLESVTTGHNVGVDVSRTDVMFCTATPVNVLPDRQYNGSCASQSTLLPPPAGGTMRLTQYEQDVAMFKSEPISQVSSSTDSGYGHGHCFNRTSAMDGRYSGTVLGQSVAHDMHTLTHTRICIHMQSCIRVHAYMDSHSACMHTRASTQPGKYLNDTCECEYNVCYNILFKMNVCVIICWEILGQF